MSALICGSLAYDTILLFPDRFKAHILPDKIHCLNVAFLTPELRREYGGTAGNIAYNYQMLGETPYVVASVGDDAGSYLERLAQLGMPLGGIAQCRGKLTAQAYITTDLDDNQITAFHPGAMTVAEQNPLEAVWQAIAADHKPRIAIVAPDGREAMLQHAADCRRLGIKWLFDPGQGLPMFDGDALNHLISLADYVVVNDYEASLLSERCGESLAQIASRVSALIVTRGGQGSVIYTAGSSLEIAAVPAAAIVDPTGCGDAYRAGLLFALERGYDWLTTGRLASLLGSIKIASRGGQNHRFSRSSIASLYASAYGQALPL